MRLDCLVAATQDLCDLAPGQVMEIGESDHLGLPAGKATDLSPHISAVLDLTLLDATHIGVEPQQRPSLRCAAPKGRYRPIRDNLPDPSARIVQKTDAIPLAKSGQEGLLSQLLSSSAVARQRNRQTKDGPILATKEPLEALHPANDRNVIHPYQLTRSLRDHT